ncbi:hypothetical protein EWM64_g1085 [Hericium alpestre]|uniref:Cytochrome b5 heme-binding domain-containing protein n=1 Tax=Hericium alpestre TaxID=135208 RepID=A0A4Z0A999_9AGAM|nr:hypothetical protein EWM64_g1085 [Hericium alpestre]
MSPQARDATIQHFMKNVHVTVFLVSLKAGGVALNLTEASRVYLMDSWWNPAVEYQAMDRIHRLGQHRPVQAIKLVIEDSIESRIVQLQEKKSAMVDATLSTDDSAMGRLTPEDKYITDMSKQLKEFTREDVALWIVVDSKVYDLSRFAKMHPGGPNVLYVDSVAGKDATQVFFGLHREEVLRRPQYARLQIGTIAGEQPAVRALVGDALSAVPYAEPSWLVPSFASPYYTEGHRRFQRAMRQFVMDVVYPDSVECEETGKRIDQGVVDKLGEMNIIAMRLGPGAHLKGRTLMGGVVQPEEFDYFHELIIHFELARLGARGYMDGLLAGAVIGVPPVLNFGTPAVQQQVLPDLFAGKKFIALAISEAFAGSDRRGLDEADQDRVLRDGGHRVRHVRPRARALANTLGKEGDGMRVILSNFNHERWMIACTSLRTQRLVVEESLLWTNQRQIFGKTLAAQAVVRAKLAAMIARVEAAQNWLENITHQMNNMSYKEQSDNLAGPIALLKQFVTRTGRETAEDATQIFGGRGITKTGMGKVIENYHRTSPYDAILGGAEDVLGDLGVRQALKKMPRNVRL